MGTRTPRAARGAWTCRRARRRWRALPALPRTVGVHPATGRTILAGVGHYGPWLKPGAHNVPLPDDEEVLAVGLNRAVALVDARQG